MSLTIASPLVIEMLEQTSGVYWATLTDDDGNVLPGNVLNTLLLTLYVIKSDGTIGYVHFRNAQPVLNLNDVLVYGTLQTRADGFTYNLRWSIQLEDTALVEDLPFERHIALFQFTWPKAIGGQGNGKHEVILNVKNLVGV